MEIQLCDVEASCVSGIGNLEEEGGIISSGRLDNLCSVFQCTQALIDSSSSESESENKSECEGGVQMVCVFDHEEIGSGSFVGAESTFLSDVMNRVIKSFKSSNSNEGDDNDETKGQEEEEEGVEERSYRNSLIVSVDMAHAFHPNYSDRHDTLVLVILISEICVFWLFVCMLVVLNLKRHIISFQCPN